jgi:hypothetical protein
MVDFPIMEGFLKSTCALTLDCGCFRALIEIFL